MQAKQQQTKTRAKMRHGKRLKKWTYADVMGRGESYDFINRDESHIFQTQPAQKMRHGKRSKKSTYDDVMGRGGRLRFY
jgi:hypothetical protein